VALMAVLKNTTYEGSPIFDIDPGSETWARTLANAQGDVAGALALLTDTAESDHINHSGSGRGALLGIPWVNQAMGVGLGLDTGGAKNGGVVAGDLYNFFHFIRIEPGETEVVVDVTIANLLHGFNPRVRLSSPSNIATAVGDSLELALEGTPAAGQVTYEATFTGCAAGLALLTFILNCERDSDNAVLSDTTGIVDVIVRKNRAGVAKLQPTRDASNPVPVVAPSAAQALFFQQMDAEVFALTFGLNAMTGWQTSRLDRNINGLLEYLTGMPAGTNRTYTHTESALVNPTRDRFRAFTRKTYAAEPIPVIPVMSLCFGGIKDDGGYLVNPSSTPSKAARRAFAPFPTAATSQQLGTARCRMPDVPDGVSSVLRWAVLAGQSSAAGWTDIRAQVQMGSETASTAAALTPVTGATHLAVLTGVALDMRRDERDKLQVFMSQPAGAFNDTNYCLLAAAVWIEP
jgi:hypothetical protein